MITRDNHTISGYSCTHRYFNDRLRTNSQGQSSSAGNAPMHQKTAWPQNNSTIKSSLRFYIWAVYLTGHSTTGRAPPKVEQNSLKSKKYSTRLPSPKQCGHRSRANLRNRRFARILTQVQWLSRWWAALHLAKSLSFTDKSMKIGSLSVIGLLEKWWLRTKWSKMAVCP